MEPLITVARNIGLEKKDREAKTLQIEKFLLQTMHMHGLAPSDIVNVSLEKYLKEKGYLTKDSLNTLSSISSISSLEKAISENSILA